MLLGAVFLEPGLIHELTLEPCHFSSKENQLLFQAMRALQAENKPIDPVMMVEKLGSSIETIGGVHYITSLAASCPATANYEYYQDIVLKNYKLRILTRLAAQFLNEKSFELAEEFYQTYINLQDYGKSTQKTTRDFLLDVYQEMTEDPGELSGVDTGFPRLNSMLNGLQKGDLIILAARPSVGKTALALNLAKNCCQQGGIVDFFSLEMPGDQLIKRMLSDLSSVEGPKWKQPYYLFDEKDQVLATDAFGILDQWKLKIHDKPRLTVTDIRSTIQKTKREHPNGKHLVVIDYLQLITQPNRFERQDLAVGDMTRKLKQIARKYEVPVVLISQLSRGVEQRADKRPVMSDLRDSGNIEQDADVIMLLSREEFAQARPDKSELINVHIAKQRNGPTGVVKLLFEKRYCRFRDLRRKNV